MQSSSYQLPKTCWGCGETPASHLRTVHGSRLSGFGYYFLVMTVSRNIYSFNVPVCQECSDKLDRSEGYIKTARTIFSVLFSHGFLYLFAVTGYPFIGIIIPIVIYAVWHLAMIKCPIPTRGLGAGIRVSISGFLIEKFLRSLLS